MKISKQKYEKFLKDINSIDNYDYKHLRKGQTIFVIFWRHFPNIANELTGTEYDCFYVDSKISLFLKRFAKRVT